MDPPTNSSPHIKLQSPQNDHNEDHDSTVDRPSISIQAATPLKSRFDNSQICATRNDDSPAVTANDERSPPVTSPDATDQEDSFEPSRSHAGSEVSMLSPPISVSVPISTPVSTETILDAPPLYLPAYRRRSRSRSPEKGGSLRAREFLSVVHGHSITPPPDNEPPGPSRKPNKLTPLDLQKLREAMLGPKTPLSKEVESAIEPRASSTISGPLTPSMPSRSDLSRREFRNMSSPPISRRKQSPSSRGRSYGAYGADNIRPDKYRVPGLNLPPIDIRDSETVRYPHRPRSAVINPTAFVIPDLRSRSDSLDIQDDRDRYGISQLPLPPMSFPAHLELELSASRPPPAYIYRPEECDEPYESMAVKFNRLKNMLLLPPFLERTLVFGVMACLDAWLYTFTILPMRFCAALWVLVKWWGYVVAKEIKWITGFVWYGLGRLWKRARRTKAEKERDQERVRHGLVDPAKSNLLKRISHLNTRWPHSHTNSTFRHRRIKSEPSTLSSFHKADLLQGAVILCSCLAMMKLDGSRMYHFVRGQSDIKLYVIFNILEVGDKLLSAVGQDVLECLFSAETLSRNAQGRSKLLMPAGMFLLALVYTVAHAGALYLHTITLNVAVNSYSNALLTLLMSNQFVEVKSTVFKKFEKDNLFQLTCADVVERFQLMVMLAIIGLRNVVEMGGLSVPSNTGRSGGEAMPIHSRSILPHAFTVLPDWLLSGEVLSPFVIVVASEVFVDAIKHSYIGRFNSIKPGFYGRILDILCKDYYTDAFVTPSLTRRLGLATIPLSCLFIRASIQTYHMFLSTHLAPHLSPSTQTALSQQSAMPSPAIIEALTKFDALIRDSLGRSVHGNVNDSPDSSTTPWYLMTSDDIVATLTMLVVFFIVFLVALIIKLLLGMALLHYSRGRYGKWLALDEAERDRKEDWDAGSKRMGGFGIVEVTEDKKRHVTRDLTEGAKKGGKVKGEFIGVSRYEMVAKRIW